MVLYNDGGVTYDTPKGTSKDPSSGLLILAYGEIIRQQRPKDRVQHGEDITSDAGGNECVGREIG
jgi:hypothetical protein